MTPNLMVVVPTSHDVTLTYGRVGGQRPGLLATLIGVVALVALVLACCARCPVPAMDRAPPARSPQPTPPEA